MKRTSHKPIRHPSHPSPIQSKGMKKKKNMTMMKRAPATVSISAFAVAGEEVAGSILRVG